MPLRQNTDNCFFNEIGKNGLSRETFESVLARCGPVLGELRETHTSGEMALLGLPAETGDLEQIRSAADWLSDGSTDVVILGTGGSSLGGQTLAQVAGWRLPVTGDFREGPRLHFLDNLDPASLGRSLDALPLETTRFLVVSKSGGTGETLIQAMAVLSALEQADLGEKVADHVMALTEPIHQGKLNKLSKLLAPHGVRTEDHHTCVGGRFSALTNVGLIPATLAGLDPALVRKGAATSLAPVLAGTADTCPSAVGAALAVGFAETREIGTDVLMAYSDRLERLTRWFVQLWAESLGKDGKGMTPIAAIGPVDQHSALQLFLDGPADKFFTIIMTDCRGRGPRIDQALAEEAGQPDFGGRTVGSFVLSQQRATADTLARNGRPVRSLLLDSLNEESIGALLMHFMLETIIAARLIGVDPFDQPAVEEGKELARAYLADLKEHR